MAIWINPKIEEEDYHLYFLFLRVLYHEIQGDLFEWMHTATRRKVWGTHGFSELNEKRDEFISTLAEHEEICGYLDQSDIDVHRVHSVECNGVLHSCLVRGFDHLRVLVGARRERGCQG